MANLKLLGKFILPLISLVRFITTLKIWKTAILRELQFCSFVKIFAKKKIHSTDLGT